MPSDVDEFGLAVRNNLLKVTSPEALITGENFERIWPNFGPDEKLKVIESTKLMVDKGYGLKPFYVKYFTSIDLAVSKENLTGTELVDFLNVSKSVIEFQSPKELNDYLNFVIGFFEDRALYSSPASRILVRDAAFSFEYHETSPVDFLEASVEPQVVDDPPEDNYDDYDDYDDDQYDDYNYEDDEYDSYDEYDEYDDETDPYEDNYDDFEEEKPIDEYFPDPPPPLRGPVIRLTGMEMDIVSSRKTATVKNTGGTFVILDQILGGEGGKMDWSTGGLDQQAEVSFDQFNFDVTGTTFDAKASKLSYDTYLSTMIEGEFSYDGRKPRSGTNFVSYKNNIDYKSFGHDGLSLKGGFSLVGKKVVTKSKIRGPSDLTYTENGVRRFRGRADYFEIEDSTIHSVTSQVAIFHNSDSIYHPATRIDYNPYTKDLLARTDNGEYRYAPFHSSFIQMDITADLLKWNLDSDSLEISIISGKSELPVLFQSEEYYSSEVLNSLSKNYSFNPLMLTMEYVRRTHAREFLADDIAEFSKQDPNEIDNALTDLVHWGYLNYDRYTMMYSTKSKTRHIYMSRKNKVDFDNLLVLSKVNSGPNVIFDVRNEEMYVNGIEKFYISEVLDVYIEPDSNRVSLGKNRSFNFDGKLYAGNFEYDGKDFSFRYDSFLFDLNQIEKIQLYTKNQDELEGGSKSKISNYISGISEEDSAAVEGMTDFERTSGTLFINKPDNKSGRQMFPHYPKFEGGGSGFIVYFAGQEYLDGVYGKSMFVILPPFNLDSLSDSDPAAINFAGEVHTGDMLPVFKEKLHIRPDQSLGFDHSIPPEGYPLFGGDATIFNRITMDGSGLRSQGQMNYLTSTIYANEFVYYPDSIVSDGSQFTMRPELFNGVDFPDLKVNDFQMKWLTKVDSMHIMNKSEPINLFNGIASLDGRATVSKKGVFGGGTLLSLGSETLSDEFNFKSDRISARHAEFEVKSSDPEKPALAGNDISLNFDLTKNIAEISPEIEGEAAVEFPYAQFKTSIPSAVWNLDSSTVVMTKPEEIDIESSYFYTTREDLDSLRFNATGAVYDINTLELKVTGIPYIIAADAKITPENGEVLILENSRIGTLSNTTIVLDTLNGYHRLFDGTIDIVSRNEFHGSATYEFVNAVEDTFAIKLGNFRLEAVETEKSRKEPALQTVAEGNVLEDDELLISPGMYYKGIITMEAKKPALELDGFVKLDLKKPDYYNTWIAYSSDAEQQEVILDFDNSETELGGPLIAGLFFDYNDFSLYTKFVDEKNNVGDENFFTPSGNLSFDPDSSEYRIVEENKDLGLSYAGKLMTYNEQNSLVMFEGPANFVENSKDISIEGSVIGNGNFETNEYEVDALLALSMNVPTAVFDLMAMGLMNAIDEVGAAEAIQDRTSLLYKLADFIGDKAAKDYETRSNEDYTPLGMMSPRLNRPLVLPELTLKWDENQKSFHNPTPIVGVSNILRTDLNAAFEGFFEIRKSLDGDRIDLFIKGSPDYWYYFSFFDNKLLIYSSDEELNNFVKQKTNQGKAKISEFVFAPGDRGETQTFVDEFRRVYYGIKEPYDLGGEVKTEETEDEVSDDDDEGFEQQ